MNNIKTILTTTILLFALQVLGVACINKKNNQVLPVIPAVASVYSAQELGIEPVEADSATASLPVISESEKVAIKDTLVYMEDQGMMTTEYWEKSSVSQKKVLFEDIPSDANLDLLVEGKYTAPTVSLAVVLEREGARADVFFKKMSDSLSVLTDAQVINIRQKLTISLVTLKLQTDYQDSVNGLPEEYISMVRTKTVAARKLVNEELVRRGITSL